MYKILVVEDDISIAELERDYLEVSGCQVVIKQEGSEVMQELRTNDYAAILLDIMLPGKNGFELCREIRKELDIPILIVTAKKNDVDKVRGLSLEADDYIVKPFSPSELVARVTSHIRIHERLLVNKEKADQSGIKIGRLKILPQERKVFFDRKEKELANKEFELLLFLAENPNIVFSKEYLFERVWGADSEGSTATVTVHINRLREKLEPNASTPQYIETVWGRGYRMRRDKL